MEPEAELAILLLVIFFFSLFAYAVLNNSPWFARFVKIFKFKSETELNSERKPKHKQSGNSPDASSTKVEGEDRNATKRK